MGDQRPDRARVHQVHQASKGGTGLVGTAMDRQVLQIDRAQVNLGDGPRDRACNNKPPTGAKCVQKPAEARPAAAGDGEGAAALAPADADADAGPPATGNPKAARKKGAEKSVEPFVADWEQGAGADGDGATSYGYRLQVADTEVLFSLSTIAERAGGRVRDSAGRALQPRRLGKSDDYAQLVIEVPVEGAEQMHRELRGMGGDAVAAPPTPAIYGPEVGVFMVEVRYTP